MVSKMRFLSFAGIWDILVIGTENKHLKYIFTNNYFINKTWIFQTSLQHSTQELA
jgi:hypothetical protein